MVALDDIASETGKDAEGFGVFDTLDDDGHAEVVPQFDDAENDERVASGPPDRGDERSVDFQFFDLNGPRLV